MPPLDLAKYVLAALAALFVGWLIFRRKTRHRIVELAGRSARVILDHPWKTLFTACTILVIAYFILEFHALKIVTTVAAKYLPDRRESRLFVTMVGIVGLVITAIGSWFTYHQLRLANDRIDGYDKLYEWVLKLLEELRERRGMHFWFYGSTILPGNISHRDTTAISRFKSELYRLFDTSSEEYGHVTYCHLLVPSQRAYEKTYAFFETHQVSGLRKSPEEWARLVRDRRTEAVRLQEILVPGEAREITEIEEQDERFAIVKHSYYISNGRRVIYAVPLHYVDVADSGEMERISPELIGLTTINPSIVRAFERHFEELASPREPFVQDSLLPRMYRRHLLSPAAVRRELNKQGVWPRDGRLLVGNLVRYDQDHFGGLDLTKRCVRRTEISGASRVLDVGSGLGGPARYMANLKGCFVHGLEIQDDRYEFAVEMTEATGLGDRVRVEKVDFLEASLSERSYTHIVALLFLVHIYDKYRALWKMHSLLRKGGRLFLADLYRARPLSLAENNKLLNSIACPSLPALNEWVTHLDRVGFRLEDLTDESEQWTREAQRRREEYWKSQEALKELHGEEFTASVLQFAEEVEELFQSGILRGMVIVATKEE